MDFGKESLVYNIRDVEKCSLVAKALSSPTRLEILKLLVENAMTMTELSQKLYVSMSSVSMHTTVLKNADLISIVPKPGVHGTQKFCGIKAEQVLFHVFTTDEGKAPMMSTVLDIPIGGYSEAEVTGPCGLVSEAGYVEVEDAPYCFFHPDHTKAQLIWFTTGYLRYRISNKDLKNGTVDSVNISLEICSEAPGYNNDWPSDIYMEVNGARLGVFRSKGDYGGNRGINNPGWWRDSNSQFGDYVTLSIKEDGTYLNHKRVSKETITTLQLSEGYSFAFTVGVDAGSEYPGGINLFGGGFGNYAQDIRVTVTYQ